MLIDFKRVLMTLDDKPFKNGEVDLTLAVVCENALTTPTEKNKNLSGAEQNHRGILAMDIHRNGKVDVPVEDVTLIKEALTGIGYSYLIVAISWEMLDPKVKEVKNEKG